MTMKIRSFIFFYVKSSKSSMCFAFTARLNLDQSYFKAQEVALMWLVAAVFDYTDIEYFYHHRKFCGRCRYRARGHGWSPYPPLCNLGEGLWPPRASVSCTMRIIVIIPGVHAGLVSLQLLPPTLLISIWWAPTSSGCFAHPFQIHTMAL